MRLYAAPNEVQISREHIVDVVDISLEGLVAKKFRD